MPPALPGFGGTTSLPAGHRIFVGMLQWIGHFADAIDLPPPVAVVGHSGGGVAIGTTDELPDLAARLAPVNPMGGS